VDIKDALILDLAYDQKEMIRYVVDNDLI
jgi:hypothetical protein